MSQRTWARVEADQGTVVEQGFADAVRREPDQRMTWVVLTDGHPDLLRQVYACAKRYKVDIIVIQDLAPVLEYLWKAAYALHPQIAEKPEAWVMARAQAVLEGQPGMWRWVCAGRLRANN